MEEMSKARKLLWHLDDFGYKHRWAAHVLAGLEFFGFNMSGSISKRLNDEIDPYVSEERKRDKRDMRKLKYDMIFSRIAYRISLNQYFLFQYEKLNDKGRSEYFGMIDKIMVTDALEEDSPTAEVFANKYITYQRFGKYYKREIIEVSRKEDYSIFEDFIRRHPRFILKVEDLYKGLGTSIVDQTLDGRTAQALFDELMSSGSRYVLEECIKQTEFMSAIHPQSVNTVRFVTYVKPDHVMHLFSFLRMGCGDSNIDNASNGGISAAIDMKTGVVTTAGYREEHLEKFLFHPDTGVQIIGMQLPRWDELLALVDELAMVIPEQQYVGWDLALTDDGWVVVEGNHTAQMTAIQMMDGGYRSVFEKAFFSA